ncbi:TonB-dependent receptor [Rhodoplanes sp. TEM]|uniref:TonB-dependent receptor n=1 Tax=Rhodoplanes tepidamans TaxID=200616 RepID=A0ABT5JK96_RHOTP|nr:MULTISPECIES: TonB-dependent receptor [Rhodoplanes]MDC7789425.1 TonB-dependent receptor [Rhodoplanes tepidamans]MDC7987063.1 TonB-dependent receptor [Rhodoplanes sp. TEM]MDQ0353598.1 iron complex outermembrane receptor protein [Rhodoplanes tepidamans]
MSHRPIRSALLLTPSLLALAGAAHAQTADEAASATAGVVTLEAIEVEARQWREDLAKVPGSVEVLSRETLADPLWSTLGAIPKVSPNVQVEQSSVQSRVVIRGITSANTALQDPVGYLVNDVVLPYGASQAPQIFDLEQMEIAKGPQGSLYGRNTEAGAIKVTTTDPDWVPTAWTRLDGSVRNGGTHWSPALVAAARASGPVWDQIAAGSVAVRAETTDGVYRNLYDGADTGGEVRRWTVSSGVVVRAGPDTDITLKSVVERNDQGKQRMRYLTGRWATPAFTTNYDTPAWDDATTAVQSLRIDHRFGGVDLVSVTGWTHYDRDFQMDLDTGPLATLPTLLSHTDDAWSQEIRLASADKTATVRWLAGLHGFRDLAEIDYRAGTPRVRRLTEIDQTGFAGFGQVEVALTDRLRAGAGSRVEWIRQDGDQQFGSTTTSLVYGARLEQTTLLPRFTLAYDVTPEAMLYGSYARGYLPGGFNYAMATSAATFAYDPEYSWTAEAGVKARLLDGRLAARLALFHTTTKDKQIIDLVPGGAQTIANAARAEIQGVELSLDGRLSERWRAYATLGLQHAEATDYVANVLRNGVLVTVDLSGNRLPMAADVTWSAGLRYDEGQGWFGQLGLRGSGPFWFDSQNTIEQSAFTLVDAEIGRRVGSVEVSLFAANILGESVYSRAVSTTAGIVVEDGNPREIGLRVKATW